MNLLTDAECDVLVRILDEYERFQRKGFDGDVWLEDNPENLEIVIAAQTRVNPERKQVERQGDMLVCRGRFLADYLSVRLNGCPLCEGTSTTKELWYCEELDYWSDSPSTFIQEEANKTDVEVSLTFRKGKQIKLADHLNAKDTVEHLNNLEDVCGLEENAMFPANDIPDEKMKELDRLLKAWANSIDYPWWQDDPDAEEISFAATPIDPNQIKLPV